ncbi:hypothetical protein TNCV_1208371 [Trichonephila clavipes]|nr:hypothetical protein TNCV_1208371 [Trichonephila clavipes]
MTDPSLAWGWMQSGSYACPGVFQTYTCAVVGRRVKDDSSDHIMFLLFKRPGFVSVNFCKRRLALTSAKSVLGIAALP